MSVIPIEKVTPAKEANLTQTAGEWIKYSQGADHMPLVKSLQGYGAGWYAEEESTAKTQLAGGDFYVYYSYDQDHKPTIPRVVIRMQGSSIGEVRGIAKEQNLDPYIASTQIVDQKLKEFPDGEKYKKKTADMKQLTDIERRVKKGESLNSQDLKFLYEIDDNIEGFGYYNSSYNKDPKIAELIAGRNIKADISLATGYSIDQISTKQEEALRGNIKYHYGDIDLRNLSSVEGIKLPENMSGTLNLFSLTSAEGLQLPQSVGWLILRQLTSGKGLLLPKSIKLDLDLGHLISAEGLTFPQSVGEFINLSSLITTEGLQLPQLFGGLSLRRLSSIKGLQLPHPSEKYPLLFLGNIHAAERELIKQVYPEYEVEYITE